MPMSAGHLFWWREGRRFGVSMVTSWAEQMVSVRGAMRWQML